MKIGTVMFVLAVLAACVPAKTKTWISRPTTEVVQHSQFKAQITPLRRDKEHFVSFELLIKNKTDQELRIDWNQTRYLLNGKAHGPFVFPDIDPATIKKSIPSATIPAGSTFTKEVFPLRLVAFAPIREQFLDGEGRGLYPGPLPSGKNTMDLIIYQGERQLRQQMTVDILEE